MEENVVCPKERRETGMDETAVPLMKERSPFKMMLIEVPSKMTISGPNDFTQEKDTTRSHEDMTAYKDGEL